MARHFVRLKAALLLAGLRLSLRQLLGFVVSVLVILPLSLAGFALLWWLGGEAAGGTGLRLAYAALAFLWVVGPPLAFGLDETLDPARLRLLPLSRWQLATGLLAASAVGVGPVGTLVVLSGAIPGFSSGAATALVTTLAVLAQFLLCLLAARTVTTLLSARLRSRRGQDLLLLAGAGMGIVFAGLGQLPRLLAGRVDDGAALAGLVDRIDTVAGATPLAWTASAIVAAAEGRMVAASGWLAATAALIAALGAVWGRALARGSEHRAPARAGADRPLFSGLSRALPRNRLGAAAARELRYQWRVPQLRVQWIVIPLVGAALVAGALLVPEDPPPIFVLAVCGLVAFQAFSAVNAFGGDRGAVWTLVAAGGIGSADLAGKNLAGALVLLPLSTLIAATLAALTGGWSFLPVALLGGVAVLGCAYGVGNVVSVLVPAPLPEAAGNVWASASGSGCAAGLAQGLALVVGAVLLGPAVAVVAVSAAFGPGWLLLAGAFAAVYGSGLWWLGLMLAVRIVRGRGPEMVAALSASS